MTIPDSIRAKIAELDPAAQTVIELILHMYGEQSTRLQALEAQLATYQRMLFGSRSEKLPPISDAVRRQIEEEEFAEGILGIAANAADEGDDPEPPEGGPGAGPPKAPLSNEERTKRRRSEGREKSKAMRTRRKESLSHLPVTRRRVQVTPDDLPPGTSREDFYELDARVVSRIVHVREHLEVVEYELQTLRSKTDEEVFVRACAPASVIEGGMWDASVCVYAVVSKCVDSIPLYRQERLLGRAGYAVARSVLCGLFHRAAELLAPIYCEEVVAYAFSDTRGSETPKRRLRGADGVLVVDGDSGYNAVVGEHRRTRAGCWAHARRRFWEARTSSPQADDVLHLITRLYRVEHQIASQGALGTDVHRQARIDLSTPILDEIDAWLEVHKDRVVPSSPLGTAIAFAINQRASLRTFLNDPRVPLDNNVAERALRVIALGRKNYLFVRSADTGRNLAILQTICHTCVLHRVNPYEYLQDVLVRVSEHPASKIDDLLPAAWAQRHDVAFRNTG